MVRWSWVNFQCRGVLLVWIRVGQGPTALAVGAGGGCLDIFTLIYPFSSLSPSLWETTRYRLKYCLKGSLSPKTTNQCALGLCFRVLLLKILQTKRFSCVETVLKTHKKRLQKKKKKKKKNTGRYIPDYPPFQQFYHGNEWTC